jgi:hypothetical protein
MENLGIGILWPFGIQTVIWHMLWPFGKLVAIWFYFYRFGMLHQEKIWQPCFAT